MRESMARYSRGAAISLLFRIRRFWDVVKVWSCSCRSRRPVQYSVERINNVDVTDEFQTGMQQAAAQGAQRGQQLVLNRLQQSPTTQRARPTLRLAII